MNKIEIKMQNGDLSYSGIHPANYLQAVVALMNKMKVEVDDLPEITDGEITFQASKNEISFGDDPLDRSDFNKFFYLVLAAASGFMNHGDEHE